MFGKRSSVSQANNVKVYLKLGQVKGNIALKEFEHWMEVQNVEFGIKRQIESIIQGEEEYFYTLPADYFTIQFEDEEEEMDLVNFSTNRQMSSATSHKNNETVAPSLDTLPSISISNTSKVDIFNSDLKNEARDGASGVQLDHLVMGRAKQNKKKKRGKNQPIDSNSLQTVVTVSKVTDAPTQEEQHSSSSNEAKETESTSSDIPPSLPGEKPENLIKSLEKNSTEVKEHQKMIKQIIKSTIAKVKSTTHPSLIRVTRKVDELSPTIFKESCNTTPQDLYISFHSTVDNATFLTFQMEQVLLVKYQFDTFSDQYLNLEEEEEQDIPKDGILTETLLFAFRKINIRYLKFYDKKTIPVAATLDFYEINKNKST